MSRWKFTYRVYYIVISCQFFLRKYIFVDQVSCFDIKFLIFVWNAIFPLPSQLPRRNKKYMWSLYFRKSRKPGDDPVKRARVVWKLKKTENSNCNNNCLSMFISCSTSYLISSWRGHVFVRRWYITRKVCSYCSNLFDRNSAWSPSRNSKRSSLWLNTTK